MAKRIVSTSRVIAASPEAIFDVLCDPTKHPIIDGSGWVKHPIGTPTRLVLGSKFSMDMQIQAKYKTVNVVSEYEENRLIAWHHWANLIWRYQLEPVEGGTKVTAEKKLGQHGKNACQARCLRQDWRPRGLMTL
jgi:Polyketide cyclase / dehydrase and lipid transport